MGQIFFLVAQAYHILDFFWVSHASVLLMLCVLFLFFLNRCLYASAQLSCVHFSILLILKKHLELKVPAV
jgi:hypothetical protein